MLLIEKLLAGDGLEFISSDVQMEVDDKISSARYRYPLSPRGSTRFIAEGGKGRYPDME